MSKGKFDAKMAMAWAKSRWSLVAFVVVAVLLVPTMVYFAMGLMAKKHAEFQEQVKKDNDAFLATSVEYNVPAIVSGAADVRQSRVPNEAVTLAFKDARDRQQAATAGLMQAAVNHNQNKRQPLLERVFPQIDVNDLALAKQFRRVYVNDGVRTLLETINARPPMAPADVVSRLNEYSSGFIQREIGNDAVDRLPDEKKQQLAKELLQERIAAYAQYGEKLSVYATPAIFSNLPANVEADNPTPQQLWDWQVQYWTMQDVMQAVADANASARDQGVNKSVVKRIERLAVDNVIPAQQTGGPPVDPSLAPPDGAPDYAKSITGRKTGSLYDVVTVSFRGVVATKDLPRFFDAIAKANLMTVTDVKLDKVDQSAELKDGYYYGLDGVTRIEMTVEAVWLREWTKNLMPKEVKVALGLETADPAAAPGASPGTPAPGAPVPAGQGGAVGG